jgi:hypothetical protein
MADPVKVYRVKGGECVSPVLVPGWGERLAAVKDPDVVSAPFEGVRPTMDPAHRMPAQLFQDILALYWKLCREGAGEEMEVGVLLCRSETPPHAEWTVLVPRQVVGRGALTYDLEDVRDLRTGAKHVGIPAGLLHVGTSHSHNTMGAFFSGTDDRDERAIPGFHLVIGNIDKTKNTYSSKGRIVDNREFHACKVTDFVDTSTKDAHKGTFHQSVLDVIDASKPVVYQLKDDKPTSRTGEARPRFESGWSDFLSDYASRFLNRDDWREEMAKEIRGRGGKGKKGKNGDRFTEPLFTYDPSPMTERELESWLPVLRARLDRLSLEQLSRVNDAVAEREFDLTVKLDAELDAKDAKDEKDKPRGPVPSHTDALEADLVGTAQERWDHEHGVWRLWDMVHGCWMDDERVSDR